MTENLKYQLWSWCSINVCLDWVFRRNRV